jgi:integrase
MARKLRSTKLDTRNARLQLPKQDGRPHFTPVAPGIALGYRAGPGSWSVRFADGKGGKVLKSLNAIADDHEDADGEKVLTFWMATDRARRLGRGQDAEAGKPLTVDKALSDYAAELKVNNKNPSNATQPRRHLTAALLATPVAMLEIRALKKWRDNLLAKPMLASTVNRICTSLKAALNLAATLDGITDRTAWTVGLKAVRVPDDTKSNLVLTDDQRRDIVSAAYACSESFGIYVEVHAATGARSSQIVLLNVGDLHLGARPLLNVPSSLKGRNCTARTSKPMPITPSLAKRLKQAAAGRSADQPLLLLNGRRWKNASRHRQPFAEAAKAAGLPQGATMYCLRHTAVTRALLAGVPVRLVASSFDTSIVMLEKTYSKFISNHGDDQMRRAVFDVDAPADCNVVHLAI